VWVVFYNKLLWFVSELLAGRITYTDLINYGLGKVIQGIWTCGTSKK
jgi:hypothetical protein